MDVFKPLLKAFFQRASPVMRAANSTLLLRSCPASTSIRRTRASRTTSEQTSASMGSQMDQILPHWLLYSFRSQKLSLACNRLWCWGFCQEGCSVQQEGLLLQQDKECYNLNLQRPAKFWQESVLRGILVRPLLWPRRTWATNWVNKSPGNAQG